MTGQVVHPEELQECRGEVRGKYSPNTVDIGHSAVFSLQFAVFSVQSLVCSLLCAVFSVKRKVCSVQYNQV